MTGEPRREGPGAEGSLKRNTQMHAAEGASGPPAKKRVMPPSRVAFLVFLIIGSAAIVIEWRARSGYTRTVEALEEAYQKAQEDKDTFSREDLEELVHGSPSRTSSEQEGTEVFTWRGIRTRRLTVEYSSLGLVTKYSTD